MVSKFHEYYINFNYINFNNTIQNYDEYKIKIKFKYLLQKLK
jgi:hypothetical protein